MDGHVKRGHYVGSHLHLNVTYLFVADPSLALRKKPDENSGVRWVALDEIFALSSEPWMCERVYEKLIARDARAPRHGPAGLRRAPRAPCRVWGP